jgi:hypothetical protein
MYVVSVSGNNRVAIGSPGKNVDEINSGLAAAYKLDTTNDKWMQPILNWGLGSICIVTFWPRVYPDLRREDRVVCIVIPTETGY